MARKTKFGNCVYCGLKKTVTRDHVFSKALFVPPYPEDMITVYSCKECNESFSLDEEYFRIIIAGGSTFTKDGQKLWHKKVIGSSFKRSSKLKNKIGYKIISV